MKKLLNRVVTGLITLSLLASLACHANNTQEITSFSDVPPAYWGYETIMDMTEYRIFKGTTTPVDGVGTFSPEKTMTRAEFITAALRAVYPTEAEAIELDKDQWWRGYYVLALDKKLIKTFELDDGDLNQPMSREEMAMIMVRCVENMGEILDQRVATSQIADYYNVAEYYKEYVRECFSFGLLCGVDSKGTFMPAKTLTRAEAATVLCRLIDEDMRVDVGFVEEPTETERTESNKESDKSDKDDNRWDSDDRDDRNDRDDNTGYDENESSDNDQRVEGDDKKPNTNNSSKDENKKPEKENNKETETEKPEKNEPEPMPWEVIGAKQPKDYTYKEYNALTTQQKLAFQATFDTEDEFNDWMDSFLNVSEKYPGENGGKQPEDYTWEEYEDLSATQQVAFQDTFKNSAAFIEWMEQVKNSNKYPLENGGKQPEDYTWEEYEALSAEMQMAFQNSFKNNEAFSAWMNEAKNGSNDSGNNSQTPSDEIPWENNGKAPEDYTWREFEKLTGAQQIAFQNYLGERGFEEWMERVQNSSSDNPWENGGKDPEDYTWAEFEALDGAQQIAFQNYLGQEGFEEWMERVQNAVSDNPWENGGKDPEEYTWAEFEALDGAQQIAFQNYLGEKGFEEWFNKNYVG